MARNRSSILLTLFSDLVSAWMRSLQPSWLTVLDYMQIHDDIAIDLNLRGSLRSHTMLCFSKTVTRCTGNEHLRKGQQQDTPTHCVLWGIIVPFLNKSRAQQAILGVL